MFRVTVSTGPSQAFHVDVDRIPVAGDFIGYQHKYYGVLSTWMDDGGGTNVNGKIQPGKKGAASTAKKPG
jgi:hypothetical protein